MNHLALIFGPSGSGKSTLSRFLMKKHEGTYQLRSTTTREPRPSDVMGEMDYVSSQEFLKMRLCGEFVEWSQFGENGYGTHKQEIIKMMGHKLTVKVIDPSGADAIVEALSGSSINLHTIYVHAPASLLVERLRKRDGDRADGRIHRLHDEIETCFDADDHFSADNRVRHWKAAGDRRFPFFPFEDEILSQ